MMYILYEYPGLVFSSTYLIGMLYCTFLNCNFVWLLSADEKHEVISHADCVGWSAWVGRVTAHYCKGPLSQMAAIAV